MGVCTGPDCCFGARGSNATCSSGKKTCALCSLPAELSAPAKAALVRTVKKLTETEAAASVEAAYVRLATVPGVAEHVRDAVGRRAEKRPLEERRSIAARVGRRWRGSGGEFHG